MFVFVSYQVKLIIVCCSCGQKLCLKELKLEGITCSHFTNTSKCIILTLLVSWLYVCSCQWTLKVTETTKHYSLVSDIWLTSGVWTFRHISAYNRQYLNQASFQSFGLIHFDNICLHFLISVLEFWHPAA